MMIDVERGIMDENRAPFPVMIAFYFAFMARNINTQVGKFCRDESASDLSKFVYIFSVKMISWLKSLSLVEFGITSEDGSYSSSIFIWITEAEAEVRQKTSLTRKHDGVDFPLFCCIVSAKTVMKEWAMCP